MKILIYSQYFWPEKFIVNDFALELVKNNEVDVLTGLPNYPYGRFFNGYGYFRKKKEIYKNINIYRNNIIPRKKSTTYNLILNYFSFLFFSFFKLLFLNTKNKKYDLCIVYAPSPLISLIPIFFLKKKFKFKIYLWVQDLWPAVIENKTKFKFLKFLINKLCQYIYLNSDILLLQSNAYKDYLKKNYKINDNKLFYFPNWSENNQRINYKPAIRKKLKIGYLGNIGFAQNFNNLCNILAANNLNHFEFHFYGNGRFKSTFLSKVQKLNIKNIYFHNFKNIFELRIILEDFDALFLSLSKEYKHTIPAKFQFYLSLGMPIMAIIEGSTKEIINHNNVGFACSENENNIFIKKALKFADMNLEEKKNIANNAFRLYQNTFSKEKIMQKFYGILNK